VTSERIRDKISASKRKGLWVGGMVPIGYDTKDRKITVNEAEANHVRDIFRSYLKLGSLNLLMMDLRKRSIVSKTRTLKTGKAIGGIAFTRGPLAHLLRSRFYVGQVMFKGETLAGEQPPIVDQALFNAVQTKLDKQINNHKILRTKSEALLLGRIFDDRGNRMTPSHARKGGIKYRYYISSALLQGQPERSGAVRRIPAKEIESLVVKAVRIHFKITNGADDAAVIRNHVVRIEVQSDILIIELVKTSGNGSKRKHASNVVQVPWRKTASTRQREIFLPESQQPHDARPIRSENRATLVASIARGRRWLDELIADPAADAENIAGREGCTARQVNMTISLAFLAPDLVKAAIEGRLPHGMGVRRLRDLPSEWPRQSQMLGL
jgi:site-specific DNA recombinase